MSKKNTNDFDDLEIITKQKSKNFCHEGDFYIHGEFDDTISTDIIPFLVKEIDEKSATQNSVIRFYINSWGGYADNLKDLVALIEIAKNKNIIVETYVFANAYSCGSLLAVCGTKGHRFISSFAEHLCHLGETGFSARNDKELQRNTDQAKSHFNFVRDMYTKYAKVKDLDNVIKDDYYFIRGKDIIKNGLADKMI